MAYMLNYNVRLHFWSNIRMTNNYVDRWNVIREQIIIEKVNETIRKTK